MENFIRIFPFFFIGVAKSAAMYSCFGPSSSRAIFRVVKTRYSGPRVDFYPEGEYAESSRYVYSGLIKKVSNIYFEKSLFQDPLKIKIVEAKKTLSFRGNVISESTHPFTCGAH